MKTKIRIKTDDAHNVKQFKRDERGYIDGYLTGENGRALAAVVIKDKVVLVPLYAIEVV